MVFPVTSFQRKLIKLLRYRMKVIFFLQFPVEGLMDLGPPIEATL